MRILFVWPNKDSFGFKPIGLSLLSAIAKNLMWNVKLFDTTSIDLGYMDNTESGQTAKIFKPVDLTRYNLKKQKLDLKASFLKTLEDFQPDCLAFTVLSDEFLIAGQLSNMAKKIDSKIAIIWGGKYPTLNPINTLQRHGADFVCIGEGLDAFGDFLKMFPDRNGLYKIPNIWAKKNGEIIKNNIRPLRRNLDDLPFVDWDIFDARQFVKPFNGKAYVGGDHMLNWGCPYHCTYCINHYYHQLYNNKYFLRRYSVERIIRELQYLKNKHKLEFFKFHDEDFLMRPVENLRELSSSYKNALNIPFVIETNPKSVTEEKVRLLKEMNCVSASIAIETGDIGMRRKVLKRVDSKGDILRAFYLFRDVNIRTSAFNLLGIPFESRKTYLSTVRLNKIANVQYPSIGFFYPFEGTELRKVSIEKGFFNEDAAQTIVYRRDKPSLNFKHLSEKALVQMRNVFVLYVKLPKTFWPFIKRSEVQDSLGKQLRRKILGFYEETVWKNDGWYVENNGEKECLQELKDMLSRERKYSLKEDLVYE